ncbi:SH3 domain-containing protein [Colwellia sp. RSH04]|uniref:SH3 domain-containing protein n=1 Tax=Colwellia sp. RSH04 TaxID=2305464 RepID=UPI000E594200|nr:SH3 domain-containing protein [Colwellia sp. RSH04]RHW77416.1 glycoside hydrolase [Colwellia sp. RSH04]
MTKRVEFNKSILLNLMCIVFIGGLTSFSLSAQSQPSKKIAFETDVIAIEEKHLTVDYWLNKLSDKDKRLMSKHEISAFNQALVHSNPYIEDPLATALELTKSTLSDKVNQIISIPNSARYFTNKTRLTEGDYLKLRDNVNLAGINEVNAVSYALVIQRSVLRTFPTWQRAFKLNDDGEIDQALDLFQESGIFPGEAVAVLHKSKDGLWALVQAYNYLAWMPAKDLAIGEKEQISKFINAKHFVTVTGGKVFVDISRNSQQNESSLLQLDMGVRLPIIARSDYATFDIAKPDNVNGQNPYANYIVQFPAKNSVGKLVFTALAIPKSKDVVVGTLAMTQENIIKQSFKFLGERYGWGHDFNGRDCTGFIGEIYKSFGLLMPRNSGQQAKSDYGQNIRFSLVQQASEKALPLMVNSEKQEGLQSLQVGDLLYLPGHVVMFLGMDNGQPYIIHDVKDYSVVQRNGELYQGVLNGVSVTPLLPLKDYVNQLSVIKRITQPVNKADLMNKTTKR